MTKVPELDDVDGQITALVGALSSALLTATDVPAMSLAPMLDPIARQLHAYGVRQTEHLDPEAVHAPSWLRDGAAARAMPVPEQPTMQHAEPPVAVVAEAPPIPKKIPAAAMARQVTAS